MLQYDEEEEEEDDDDEKCNMKDYDKIAIPPIVHFSEDKKGDRHCKKKS